MLVLFIIISVLLTIVCFVLTLTIRHYVDLVNDKNEQILELEKSVCHHTGELEKRSEVQFDDLIHLKYKR